MSTKTVPTPVAKIISYCRRFAKAWDYFLIAADSYRAGYTAATEDFRTKLGTPVDAALVEINAETTEMDYTPGDYQLSTSSFARWEELLKNQSLREHLENSQYFVFDDLRVVEDNGVISFQGTARRKV